MAGQARRVVLIKCGEDELAAVLHCVHICLSNKENCLIFALAYFSGPALSPLSFAAPEKMASRTKKGSCAEKDRLQHHTSLQDSCEIEFIVLGPFVRKSD
jgi:hypothetical protein